MPHAGQAVVVGLNAIDPKELHAHIAHSDPPPFNPGVLWLG